MSRRWLRRTPKRQPIPVELALDDLPKSDRQLWDGEGIDVEQIEREAREVYARTCGMEYRWEGHDPHYIFICLKEINHSDGWHEGITADKACKWRINSSGDGFDSRIRESGRTYGDQSS